MEMCVLEKDLKESFMFNLEKQDIAEIPKMRVMVSCDKSGSFSDEFEDGSVDAILSVASAVALTFDDNGSLELSFFNADLKVYPDLNINNPAKDYVKRHKIKANGGTAFAPSMEWFMKPEGYSGLFGKLKGLFKKVEFPTYAMLITDGDNQDYLEFTHLIEQFSQQDKMFLQIVGVGNGVRYDYMNSIASGVDNISFIHIKNAKTETQESFLEKISNEKLVAFIKTL